MLGIRNNALTQNLSPWAFSRAEKSHRTFRNLRLGQVPLKIIFSNTVGTIVMSVQRSISSPKIMKKELQILVFFALCSLAFLKIGNHKLLKNNFVYILILILIFSIGSHLMVSNLQESSITEGEKH